MLRYYTTSVDIHQVWRYDAPWHYGQDGGTARVTGGLFYCSVEHYTSRGEHASGRNGLGHQLCSIQQALVMNGLTLFIVCMSCSTMVQCHGAGVVSLSKIALVIAALLLSPVAPCYDNTSLFLFARCLAVCKECHSEHQGCKDWCLECDPDKDYTTTAPTMEGEAALWCVNINLALVVRREGTMGKSRRNVYGVRTAHGGVAGRKAGGGIRVKELLGTLVLCQCCVGCLVICLLTLCARRRCTCFKLL